MTLTLTLPGRRSGSRRSCPASGWNVRPTCARDDGTVVCPCCSQLVASRPRRQWQGQVRVVAGHLA